MSKIYELFRKKYGFFFDANNKLQNLILSMDYYVDTCIWLNLFKKEGDPTKRKPYWKIAEEFLKEAILTESSHVFYSTIVLRELELQLAKESYEQNKQQMEAESKFIKVDVLSSDKIAARKLESRYEFLISYYDLLHLTIAKRLHAILITRDRRLIAVAHDQSIIAERPEDTTVY